MESVVFSFNQSLLSVGEDLVLPLSGLHITTEGHDITLGALTLAQRRYKKLLIVLGAYGPSNDILPTAHLEEV